MKALLAPIALIGMFYGILTICKTPTERPIKIGDCYSSPTALVVKKIDNTYFNQYYGMTWAETTFKVVDIKVRNNVPVYVLRFFKEPYKDESLSDELFIIPPEQFEVYKKVINQFSDYPAIVCNSIRE